MELTKDNIVNLLETNDKAIGRALMVLHANQTADEQAAETVRHRNGMGFRPCHARMGSSMATFYANKGYLTAKQAQYWRVKDKAGNSRIGIYWKQLIDAANARKGA